MRTISTIILLSLLSGCGVDLTGEKFREEKDDRINAEINYNESQRMNEVLKELLSNAIESETMQWVYADSKYGEPINTYDKALALCSEIRFDLPTEAQLQGEGTSIDAIKNISGNIELPPEQVVYVKDHHVTVSQFLVCVREKTDK